MYHLSIHTFHHNTVFVFNHFAAHDLGSPWIVFVFHKAQSYANIFSYKTIYPIHYLISICPSSLTVGPRLLSGLSVLPAAVP
jgi:hypothetical protein